MKEQQSNKEGLQSDDDLRFFCVTIEEIIYEMILEQDVTGNWKYLHGVI